MTASLDFDWQAIEPEYIPDYVAGLRRLTGAQKLDVAGMLYRTALSVKTAGLRRRHPDWPEAVLHREAARNLMLSSAEA